MRTVSILGVLATLCVYIPQTAYALETIPSFDARITVYANATVEVAESIVYDFGSKERHGIFRTIPYSYQAGTETYTADISSVVVTDERGNPRPFNESRGNGELTLKIGDPDTTVTGRHVYIISYVVQGPFLYFEDQDEFYWNVTGSWPTGIARAGVLVDLPVGATVLSAACYQGARDTTRSCDDDKRLVNADRAGYTATAYDLAPGEGFTFAVAFPKGTIAHVERTWKPQTEWSYSQFWPLGIPFLVLIGMVFLWSARGRDPRGRGTIVTEFAPPDDLSPSVAGIVYNERSESREVSAEIIRLAVEGYLKIHRIDEKVLLIFSTTDYLLERVHPETTPTDPVGTLLLEKLFQPSFMGSIEEGGKTVKGALLSKMQHKFVEENKALQTRMYDEVVVRKYFLARPDKVRTWYAGAGIAIVIMGVALAVVGTSPLLTLVGIGIGLSGGIIAIGGRWMPVKTAEGVRVHEALEGFKRYLTVAERDRITFHNAPERSPELFDTYLPYAMAFGVEAAWAKNFEDMYTDEPNWYHGGTLEHFAAGALAADLSSFTSDLATASMPQSSGSSGGGSVGGGFGGGGGGSW